MKRKQGVKSVIMALDESFGSLRLVPEKKGFTAAGIDISPSASEALARLEEAGVPVALAVPEAPTEQLSKDVGRSLPALKGVIARRNLSELFSAAADSFSAPSETLFVSSDRALRKQAIEHGYAAAPHPALAPLMAQGHSMLFARATGGREHFDRLNQVVPYFWEHNQDDSWSMLALMSGEAIAEAIGRRLKVEVLPLDASTEDPLFIQLDAPDQAAVKELSKLKVLLADERRVLVALDATAQNDAINLHGSHGHFLFLRPSPEIMRPAPYSGDEAREELFSVGRFPLEKVKVTRAIADIALRFPTLLRRCPVSAADFQATADRYSGAADLDASGPIVSRHVQHPDNARVVQALLDELNAMGYCAYTHSFTYLGMTLNNVIADLPGAGIFRINPDILEKLRKIFIKHPWPDPPEPWTKEVRNLLGTAWLEEQGLKSASPILLRRELEAIFELKPWRPWWLKLCPLAGLGAKIVIVGCHLDSTAARSSGYDPATDPAPGQDDDASGLTATLAIARHLKGLRRRLRHTVRFCFFNAEEQGLVGSQAYAAMLKAANAPVKATVCMDMIGYNSDPARIFEVHAGYTDPAVRDISVPVADCVAAHAASLGALAPAQIYKGTNGSNGADRNIYDGAINRSDHAAFHQQGYPAVVVSEDFFANLSTEPGADSNPNYHDDDDTVIDPDFAADITCAVAMAVKELAA